MPKLITHEVDRECFVIDDVRRAIHPLSQVGSAVWRLLETPHSRVECLDVFRAAFPEADADEMRKLIDDAIENLQGKGVIYATG